MASVGEVIYEDYLYKFTGRSRSILWGKSDPWKQRYFLLKRVGNRPILEYFNKKPKSKNVASRGKVELFPSYQVEKITNMKNRAYVFQVTTPTCTLCLSADEQRSMDMFVFFLQIQSRLKDQIREDYIPVQPENSEAQRRIGAKGTNSILHVSPYGVTLALQSNRAVLAQWPLKSIRCYESSGSGQMSIEAGRVAPMGDGLYIFQTRPGDANGLYDLLDQYVMDTVGRAQPDRRGNNEEIEDYVLEMERLLALTVVAACTSDNAEIQDIVQNNWNTDLNITQSNMKPRQVVHTRLTGSSSVSSLSSQNSVTSPPALPARNPASSSARNSPQVSHTQRLVRDSPAGSRKGSLVDRPPLPPPLNSVPVSIPKRQPSVEPYLRMDSSASKSNNSSTSQSPWTPSAADWVPPPSFKEAMRQKSQSPIAESGPYRPESYLTPSKVHPKLDSYLSPTSAGPVTSTPLQKSGAKRISVRDAYLTPSSFSDSHTKETGSVADPIKNKGISVDSEYFVPDSATLRRRMRRLRSASWDDMTDYLKSVVYDPVSKSMNDLLGASEDTDDDVLPEPFPRLQTFSGSIDFCYGHTAENYYNVEGLHGKIYDGPGLTVQEIRKKFSRKWQSSLRRSVSNPNFMKSISREKLHEIRVKSGYGSPKMQHSKKSLTNLIPDALKRHLSKDNIYHASNSALSNGGVSSHNSSRGSSTHSSRHNSFSKRTMSKEDVVAKTSVKGITVTKRSRSFRRQKACDESSSEKNENKTEIQSNVEQIKKDTEVKIADSSADVWRNVEQMTKDTKSNVEHIEKGTQSNVELIEKDTKSNADQIKKAAKSNAEQNTKDTKSNVERNEKDTKSNAEQIKKDTKSNVEHNKKDTRPNVEQNKKDTRPNVEQNKKDTKSNHDDLIKTDAMTSKENHVKSKDNRKANLAKMAPTIAPKPSPKPVNKKAALKSSNDDSPKDKEMNTITADLVQNSVQVSKTENGDVVTTEV